MSVAQYFSQHFWDNLEAKGDRKGIQEERCLFTEMTSLKTQLEFS